MYQEYNFLVYWTSVERGLTKISHISSDISGLGNWTTAFLFSLFMLHNEDNWAENAPKFLTEDTQELGSIHCYLGSNVLLTLLLHILHWAFLGSMLPQYMALCVSLVSFVRQGRRLRFGMLTVLTNIRSTKVLSAMPHSDILAWLSSATLKNFISGVSTRILML